MTNYRGKKRFLLQLICLFLSLYPSLSNPNALRPHQPAKSQQQQCPQLCHFMISTYIHRVVQPWPPSQPQSLSKCCHSQKEVSSHSSAPNVHHQRVTWGTCLDHHLHPTPPQLLVSCMKTSHSGPQSHLTLWYHPEPSSSQAAPWGNADTQTPRFTTSLIEVTPPLLLSPSPLTAARNSFTLSARPTDRWEGLCPQQSQHRDP